MGLRLEGIPEEDQEIDVSIHDLGADLLVPAQRSALELDDVKAQLLFQQRAGGAGGVYLVMRQKVPVEFRPFDQIALFAVVRHQGDLLVLPHCNYAVDHKFLFLGLSSHLAGNMPAYFIANSSPLTVN